MKQVLLICAVVLVAQTTQAQSAYNRTYSYDDLHRMTQVILAKQMEPEARYKTTGTAKRLIGQSRYEGSLLTDSTRHVYRNFKGSAHPNENSYFSNTQYRIEYFDAKKPLAVQYIQSDTSYSYQDNGVNLALLNKVINNYDGNGNQTHAIHQDDDGTYERTIITNGNGKRATVIEKDSAGSTAYTDKLKHHFIYDGQNRIIKDSAIYIPLGLDFYKEDYFYNSNGNLDSFNIYYMGQSGWEPSYKIEFLYDGSNRILTSTSFVDNGSGWERNYRDSFAYTGASKQFAYWAIQYWDVNNQYWDDDYGEIVEVDNQNNIIRKYTLDDSSIPMDTTYKLEYFYTSAGLYDSINAYRHLGNGSFSPLWAVSHFYYEDYNTVSVAETKSLQSNIKLYPNPANHVLTISTDNEITYSIVNMAGQVLLTGIVNDTHLVDISAMSRGTYILIAKDKTNIQFQSMSFVKE